MIQLKTAILLGFSLELGAVLAQAPAGDQKLLREAGINLGLGFQLKDDLLDVFADKKKFGKRVGGDIIANKKTFLLIKALEKSRGKDKSELLRWISAKRFDRQKKVAAVTALYEKLGVRELTEEKIQSFFVKGFECLALLTVKERTGNLIQFAKDLSGRQK